MSKYQEHPLNKKYDLDSLFSTLWEFYRKWFVPMFIISFIFSILSGVVSSGIDVSSLQNTTDPAELMNNIKSLTGPYLLLMLISVSATIFLQYFIVRKPVEPESDILSIISSAIVKFFLPMVVVYIVLMIFAVAAAIAGFIAFIIGIFFALIYLALFFAIAAPVMMVEESSIGETISTTFRLVHKRFWPNIGWMTIFLLLYIVVSMVIAGIEMIPFGGSVLKTITNPESAPVMMETASNPAYILFSSLLTALLMPFMPIFGLILYFNNKAWLAGNSGISNELSGPTVDDLTP